MAKVVIIGGGLSGLSLAYFLRQQRPGWEVTVLEKDHCPGGKARTIKKDGFIVELGVNGVLDNKPSTVGLARMLGLPIMESDESAKKRFVIKDGGLLKLPESPREFMTSPLLSLSGRLRVAMEPFIPQGDLSKDESVAQFAQRRLGKEAMERLIDPMATGIFAGDVQRLSLKSCFPRIHELERDFGSLIRAMIALQRAAKTEKTDKKVGAGPGGRLVSFEGGMRDLVAALASSLGGDTLQLGVTVEGVAEKGRHKWEVLLNKDESIECTHIVLACPAKDAASITKDAMPGLSGPLSAIDYPPVAVVAFGTRPQNVQRTLDGFGFLAPGIEKRNILGTLWDSSIFPNRAPEGWALLRTLLGGARRRDIPMHSDGELIDITYRELKGLMGLKKAPEFVVVHRWMRAIPQYNIGHQRLIEAIKKEASLHPGLHMRCNWIGGVSLNDCIENSRKLAECMD